MGTIVRENHENDQSQDRTEREIVREGDKQNGEYKIKGNMET